MANDDVGLGHQLVNVFEELFAPTLVPFGQFDDVSLVVPFGADNGGAGMPVNGFVVDVTVFEVAAVPPILRGDTGQAFHIQDQDFVADAVAHDR